MKMLLIVDVQKDFCPGGSLACPDGDKIVPVINKLMKEEDWDIIVATQDWHPKGHCSFASTYGVAPFCIPSTKGYRDTVWPDHCIAGSEGAELHDELDQTKIGLIIRKGLDLHVDSYSAFFDNEGENPTPLNEIVNSDFYEIYVCGIATEVCVKHTVLDAAQDNLFKDDVIIITDACAGVSEHGHDQAIKDLEEMGIRAVSSASEEFADMMKGNYSLKAGHSTN